ncbi:MAG: class I SAM-dependent methyltransferase, partial [Mycobacterium sp.]
NDTWDLATSVGATATMVAAARAIATKTEVPLIDDPFAEPLVCAVGVDFFTRWATGELNTADVDDSAAGWRLAYMPDAMAARTRYFDTFFADATRAGIRQAVILASGLDARAYRLSWPTDMTVFEIDQPQVIGFKTTKLAELGAAPTTDLRTVSIDLRHDWPAALRDAGLDSTRPTAWIAEGLLGYLPPEAQDRLLDNITALSAEGSRLAVEAVPDMSHLDVDKAREIMRKATAKWRDHGFDLEFTDLGYEGERHDVAAYLQPMGWQSVGTSASQLLADNGLAAIPQNTDSVSVADTVYYTSTLRRVQESCHTNHAQAHITVAKRPTANCGVRAGY